MVHWVVAFRGKVLALCYCVKSSVDIPQTVAPVESVRLVELSVTALERVEVRVGFETTQGLLDCQIVEELQKSVE